MPGTKETRSRARRVRRSGSLLIALVAVLAPCAQGQGEVGQARIAGVVQVAQRQPEPPRFNAYPGRAREHVQADPAVKAPGGPSDVVLYLESTESLSKVARAGRPRPKLIQAGMRFVPRVLPILVGDSVEFPNRDPFYHNVFSYSAVKRFDLGRYAEGNGSTVQFSDPGEVRVFCDIHSEMNAVILVLKNSFYAQPDSLGNFLLENVPAGRHRLVAWHPDLPAQTIEVRVPSKSALALELRF